MVVFLANRAKLKSKRPHDRIQNRLRGPFENVRRRRAEPREAGPYRVVAEVAPRQFLVDDEYPVTTARVEIGFQLQTGESHEYYWINWSEPDRSLLVGWHQDDTHDDLGPVHLQVNDGATPVAHEPAAFIDSHPLDVVERRRTSLRDAVLSVEWEQGRPVGLSIVLPLFFRFLHEFGLTLRNRPLMASLEPIAVSLAWLIGFFWTLRFVWVRVSDTEESLPDSPFDDQCLSGVSGGSFSNVTEGDGS